MIIAVEQIPWKRPSQQLETVVEQSWESANISRGVMDLNRKHYINGDAVPLRRLTNTTK